VLSVFHFQILQLLRKPGGRKEISHSLSKIGSYSCKQEFLGPNICMINSTDLMTTYIDCKYTFETLLCICSNEGKDVILVIEKRIVWISAIVNLFL
jgi:hypothetical protein